MKLRGLCIIVSAICLIYVLLLMLVSRRYLENLQRQIGDFKFQNSEDNLLQTLPIDTKSNLNIREATSRRLVDLLTLQKQPSNPTSHTTFHDVFVSKVLVSHAKPKEKSEMNYMSNLRFGHENFTDGKPLLTEPTPFQPERKTAAEVREFLSRKNLVEIPYDTDGLSPYLITTHEVINEAQRVHFNLFRDLFHGKKYALLFQIISNDNRGDAALGVGEFTLLERMGIEVLFFMDRNQNQEKDYAHALAIAQRYPAHEVVVLLQGGGNFGFHVREVSREKALRHFKGYSVIVFPMSIYGIIDKDGFRLFQKLYCCNPNMTMLLRDRLSLQIAQRLLNNGTRLLLVPDMAFQLGPLTRSVLPFYDISWLKRSDGERPDYSEADPKSLFPPNLTVSVGDWGRETFVSSDNSLKKIIDMMANGLNILQRGRVVVTDRLHGHILCILLDIPHVLLDNAYNKLSVYHNTWTRGVHNCRLASSVHEAVRSALELLEEYKEVLPPRLKAVHLPTYRT